MSSLVCQTLQPKRAVLAIQLYCWNVHGGTVFAYDHIHKTNDVDGHKFHSSAAGAHNYDMWVWFGIQTMGYWGQSVQCPNTCPNKKTRVQLTCHEPDTLVPSPSRICSHKSGMGFLKVTLVDMIKDNEMKYITILKSNTKYYTLATLPLHWSPSLARL